MILHRDPSDTDVAAYAADNNEGDTQVSEWQPIETAPTDNRLLILCRAGSAFSFIGSRHASGIAGWFDIGGAQRDPTHWQPFPKPLQ